MKKNKIEKNKITLITSLQDLWTKNNLPTNTSSKWEIFRSLI
jgi:hypothetical protein